MEKDRGLEKAEGWRVGGLEGWRVGYTSTPPNI